MQAVSASSTRSTVMPSMQSMRCPSYSKPRFRKPQPGSSRVDVDGARADRAPSRRVRRPVQGDRPGSGGGREVHHSGVDADHAASGGEDVDQLADPEPPGDRRKAVRRSAAGGDQLISARDVVAAAGEQHRQPMSVGATDQLAPRAGRPSRAARCGNRPARRGRPHTDRRPGAPGAARRPRSWAATRI